MQVRRRGVEDVQDPGQQQMNDRRDEQSDEPGPGEPGLTDGIGGLTADTAEETLHGEDAGQQKQQQRDGRESEIHRPASPRIRLRRVRAPPRWR